MLFSITQTQLLKLKKNIETKKKRKWMSKSVSQFPETDVDICFKKNKKILRNGSRHLFHNLMKQISTSVSQKKNRNGSRYLFHNLTKRISTFVSEKKNNETDVDIRFTNSWNRSRHLLWQSSV